MIPKKIIIFLFSLITVLCSFSLAEENVPGTAFIDLISPQNNLITSKDKVLFKGRVSADTVLFLNGEKLTVSSDGKFYYRALLTEKDAYNMFILRTETVDGEELEQKIKVFYKYSNLSSSANNASIQKPLINLISPQNDIVTTKQKVLFKGQVFGTDTLLLNGVTVNVSSTGEFYHREMIENNKEQSIFVLEAIAADNKTKTKLLRRIYYQDENVDTPTLLIFSPNDKVVSTEDRIEVKGELKNAKYVLINDKKVTPDKDGSFKTFVKLKNKDDYNKITFVAIKDNKKVELTRSIFFQQSSSKKIQSSEKVTNKVVQNHIPSVVINSPQNNFVTYKNHVVIKGRAQHTNELYINNRLAKLDNNGNFSEAFELSSIGKYVFNVFAIGVNELNKTSLLKLFKVHEKKEKKTDMVTTHSTTLSEKLEKLISIDLAGADIREVISILASKGDLNIVTDQSLAGEVYVSLTDVSLLDAIDFILGSQGFSYKINNNTILVGNAAFLDQPTSIETKVIRLNNADPTGIIPILSQYISGKENIQFQDNLLIINAGRGNIDRITELVSKLDEEKVPQIILEAQILEVSKSALDNIGVNWSDTYGIGVQNTLSNSAFSYSAGLSLQSVISLLESKGEARVLAKPRIKAIHGETATIFIGDKIPFTQVTVGTTGAVSESVSFVNSGINLSVFPEINIYTQEIKIKIQPEVSYVNGYRGANNDVPVVRTRRVDTTVFVENGNTVLIGGLFNSSDADNFAKFPLLGSIPLIGQLFTTNKVEQDQTELVIAITPQIINEDFKESIPLPLLKKAS
tara:strand:+ start:491 stop:2890 length:2400 start_codon:yes stop_codon:yes gene_type:complete